MRTIRRLTLILLVVALASLGGPLTAAAQEASDIALDSPVRSMELAPSEEKVDLGVDFKNIASAPRIVRLRLEGVPDQWQVAVWDRFFDYKIVEIVVEPTSPEDTGGQRPRMRIELPADRPAPGDYSFTLFVTSPDGRIEYDRATFTVTVPETAVEEAKGEVTLRSSYPFLRGPTTSQYEFEIVVRNETGEERSVDLRADVLNESNEPQQGWEVSFKPAFGDEKIISKVSVPNNLSENVDVRVVPPRNAAPGNYIIPVKVSSEDEKYQAAVGLQLTLRGRGELLLRTASGRLNVDATAGRGAKVNLVVTNIGNGDLTDISFEADPPAEGWEVTYDVPTYELLKPTFQVEIPVTVVPPDDTIPGDYLLILRSRNIDAVDSLEVRVTVTQSTIWGWLGIVLVIAVIGGLVGLFVRLGRR